MQCSQRELSPAWLTSIDRLMKMKLLLVGLVLIEAFLLVLLASPVFVDRHDTARAVLERFQHPSPEAEARASVVADRDRRDASLTTLAIFICIVADGFLIYIVAGRIRRQSINSVQPTRASARG